MVPLRVGKNGLAYTVDVCTLYLLLNIHKMILLTLPNHKEHIQNKYSGMCNMYIPLLCREMSIIITETEHLLFSVVTASVLFTTLQDFLPTSSTG